MKLGAQLRNRTTNPGGDGSKVSHSATEGFLVCGAIQAYQKWPMPHITLIKQLDVIFIPASSSLDNYTTDEVHGSSSWFQYPG